MDLFTYLLGKNGKNTHRDLFSYLLGENAGGSGTYTTFSGTSLNISNTLQAKIKNIALEGNTSQDGDPTPETPIPIKVVTGEQNIEIKNKNLLKILNLNSTFSGVQVTTNSDGSITLNGTCTSNYAINIITDWSLSLENGKTYTLSGCPDLGGRDVLSLELYSNSPTNQYITDVGEGKTFTLTADRTYRCYIAIKSGQIYDNVTLYPMVEEGPTATEYEPYQSQTYPLSLGNIELARIGNYKDYIFKNVVGSTYYNAELDLNEWYLHKDINKFTLNGVTDKWDRQTASDGYRFRCFTYQSVINSMNNSIGYSNYFKNNGDTNTHNGIFGNGGVIQLRDDNLFTTVTDVTTFLSQHNTIVYYIKKTTTNTKITDATLIQQLENINNARSYKGTTIIECTSASADNETVGFSGDIKVTSVGLGNSLNTSLLSSNIQEETNIDDIQEETNIDDVNEIEEQNDEPIENEEIEELIEKEVS